MRGHACGATRRGSSPAEGPLCFQQDDLDFWLSTTPPAPTSAPAPVRPPLPAQP